MVEPVDWLSTKYTVHWIQGSVTNCYILHCLHCYKSAGCWTRQASGRANGDDLPRRPIRKQRYTWAGLTAVFCPPFLPRRGKSRLPLAVSPGEIKRPAQSDIEQRRKFYSTHWRQKLHTGRVRTLKWRRTCMRDSGSRTEIWCSFCWPFFSSLGWGKAHRA